MVSTRPAGTAAAHLAEIIALLGPPPEDLLVRGHLANKFFSDKAMAYHFHYILVLYLADSRDPPATFTPGIDLPASNSLEEIEKHLERDEKRRFLEFMRKMIQWAPEQRSTARELFQDAWLQEQT